MTAAERRHYDAVVADGCVICEMPAEVHHYKGLGGKFDGIIIDGSCMGKKAPYWESFALCPWHHRQGGIGEAIEDGVLSWEGQPGRLKQWEYVKQTQKDLNWKGEQ